MNKEILEKARALNEKLRYISEGTLDCREMANAAAESLSCHACILDGAGKVLAYSTQCLPGCPARTESQCRAEDMPDYSSRYLAGLRQTVVRTSPDPRACIFYDGGSLCRCAAISTCLIPVCIGGKRYGTLALTRNQGLFIEEDIFMAEAAVLVASNEILKRWHKHRAREWRKRIEVETAVNTLSYSELEALSSIADILSVGEGLIVGSQLARQAGLTKSVFVSTIRKLRSAGLVESQSRGMKGTYLRVLNRYLIDYVMGLQ